MKVSANLPPLAEGKKTYYNSSKGINQKGAECIPTIREVKTELSFFGTDSIPKFV